MRDTVLGNHFSENQNIINITDGILHASSSVHVLSPTIILLIWFHLLETFTKMNCAVLPIDDNGTSLLLMLVYTPTNQSSNG